MRTYSKTNAILRVPVLQASDTFGQQKEIKDLYRRNNVKDCELKSAKGSDPEFQKGGVRPRRARPLSSLQAKCYLPEGYKGV